MKVLAVVFVACIVGALALTEEQTNKLKQVRDTCITETGADRAEVDNAHKGQWADNEKMRCFASCMLKQLKMIDADGKLDEAETRKKISVTLTPEKVEEVMTKCKDLKGADTCETGFKLMKCYTETRGPATLVA